jgi:hypothetical protein
MNNILRNAFHKVNIRTGLNMNNYHGGEKLVQRR